jgi:hypothetical protein
VFTSPFTSILAFTSPLTSCSRYFCSGVFVHVPFAFTFLSTTLLLPCLHSHSIRVHAPFYVTFALTSSFTSFLRHVPFCDHCSFQVTFASTSRFSVHLTFAFTSPITSPCTSLLAFSSPSTSCSRSRPRSRHVRVHAPFYDLSLHVPFAQLCLCAFAHCFVLHVFLLKY